MNKLLSWVIIIGGMIVLILFGLAQYNQAKAEKMYAKGWVIAQQGQARLDTLTGISAIVSAAVPHVVSILLGLIVVAIVVLFIIAIRDFSDSRAYRLALLELQKPKIIERIETRTILMLPSENMTRKELLQSLEYVEVRALPKGRSKNGS